MWSMARDMTLRRDDLKVGRCHERMIVENLTRTQIVQYAGASGDFNPLHTDEVFAKDVAGYPTVIAHGMLTMGMTAHMITDFVGDGQLLSFGGRFGQIVFPGDSLVARAEVKSVDVVGDVPIVELIVTTVNSRGEEVFHGYATARIKD